MALYVLWKLLAIIDHFAKAWGGGGVNIFCAKGVGHTIHLKAVNPIVFHPKVKYSQNNISENVV